MKYKSQSIVLCQNHGREKIKHKCFECHKDNSYLSHCDLVCTMMLGFQGNSFPIHRLVLFKLVAEDAKLNFKKTYLIFFPGKDLYKLGKSLKRS